MNPDFFSSQIESGPDVVTDDVTDTGAACCWTSHSRRLVAGVPAEETMRAETDGGNEAPTD